MGHQESTEHPEVEWPRRKNARATNVGDALLRLLVGNPVRKRDRARPGGPGGLCRSQNDAAEAVSGRKTASGLRRQFTLYRSTGLITLLAL